MKRLGYSLKVAVFVARQRNEAERAERYKARLASAVGDNPKQLIYIDETHKWENASQRQRGLAQKGKECILEAYFEEDFRKRYTLIAACNINGFVIEACKLVPQDKAGPAGDDLDPNRGTMNTSKFETYVEEHLVVIMDNASIHNSDCIEALIQGTGALLLYTAPYSPDLNPIEFMFGVYKAGLKRYTPTGFGWEYAHRCAFTPSYTCQSKKIVLEGCYSWLQETKF
jgi:transposase